MFSAKELITFVFANENDSYYGADLITRSLNQYLWEQLHRDDFSAVYFLSADGDDFRIASFGDRACNSSVIGKKSSLFFSQDKWLQQQLRADSPVAFVCPLEDFCSVLQHSKWKNDLVKIAAEKKRSGIFVLTAPPSPERTARLLLTSPVFGRELLNETAVLQLREGPPVNLYHALKGRKYESCLFLNACTKPLLQGLLTQLSARSPERLALTEQVDRLTDYLYDWLESPEELAVPLLPRQLSCGTWTYAQLFEELDKPEVWDRLVDAAAEHIPLTHHRPDRDIPVVRDSSSYAGRCLRLQLPPWLWQDETAGPQAHALLKAIGQSVCEVKNRLEQPDMIAQANSLLDLLAQPKDRDADTYLRRLSALEFCVSHIYGDDQPEKNAAIGSILQNYRDAINLSTAHYLECTSLKLAEARSKTTVLELQLRQTRMSVQNSAQVLRLYDELIEAAKLALVTASRTEHMDTLEQEIHRLQQERETVSQLPKHQFLDREESSVLTEEETPEVTQPVPEEDEEEPIILDLGKYDYVLPKN